MSKYGPRTPGTKPLFEAEKYIIEKLQEKTIFKKYYDISVKHVRKSGSFVMDIVKTNFYISYSDISNIILQINSKKHPNVNETCLFNCHYDSVFSSPGASDNLINCALMLEIIDHIIMREEPITWNCNIIFLFNGGEESLLTASHSFVTDKTIFPKKANKVFVINLDSSGTSGRALLFQSTKLSQWMIKLYSDTVRYPYASSLSQELFSFKLIPSDTDFRIFRDIGEYDGVDIAFTGNGHYYHTIYDTVENIFDFDIVMAYSNLKLFSLALVTSNVTFYRQNYVNTLFYADYVSFFMVCFEYKYLKILSILLSLLFIYNIFLKEFYLDKKLILLSIANSICLLIGPFISNILLGQLIRLVKAQMFWFTFQSLMKLVYGLFYLETSLCIMSFFIGKIYRKYNHSTFRCFHNLLQIFLSILSLYLAFFNSNLIIYLFIGQILNYLFYKSCNNIIGNKSSKTFKSISSFNLLFFILLSIIFPIIIQVFYCFDQYSYFVVPITGRIGQLPFAEFIVSSLVSFHSLVVFSIMGLIIKMFIHRKFLYYLSAFIICFVVFVPIPIFTPIIAPKRLIIQHVQMTNNLNQSFDGLLIASHDNRHMIDIHFNESIKFSQFDSEFLPIHYTSKFYFDTKFVKKSGDSKYPDDFFLNKRHLSLNLVNKNVIDDRFIDFEFEASGSNVLNIQILLLKNNDEIVNWSFGEIIEFNGVSRNNRSVFFIKWVHGDYNSFKSWKFSFRLKCYRLCDLVNRKPTISIGLTGHYQEVTQFSRDFVKLLPDFINPLLWSSKLVHLEF